MSVKINFADHISGTTFADIPCVARDNSGIIPLSGAYIEAIFYYKNRLVFSYDSDGAGITITDSANGFFKIDGATLSVPANTYSYNIRVVTSTKNILTQYGEWKITAAGGAGDITGPSSVTADRLASFNGTTGKILKDSGYSAASFEPANTNIQAHVSSAHAPSNAQKNSDITKGEIEAKLTGVISSHSHAGGSGDGFIINVQALTSSPTDGQTVYFGMLPKAPVTAAGTSKIHIRKACTLKVANIYVYSGTAGTAENWSLYVRKNNTEDTLISTLALNTNERIFQNSSLNISLQAGDYIEIKGVQPTWATNPLTTIYGGYLYFE